MGGMSKTDCETLHNLSHSENETGMIIATSRIGEFGTIFASCVFSNSIERAWGTMPHMSKMPQVRFT